MLYTQTKQERERERDRERERQTDRDRDRQSCTFWRKRVTLAGQLRVSWPVTFWDQMHEQIELKADNL